MTSALRKAIRDPWHDWDRSLLAVLAISIGLAGLLAVLSSYAVLRRELNVGYLATNPASAVLTTDVVDDQLLAAMIARPDVDDADARRVLRGRIRDANGEWQRLVLFVIRDFDRLRISTVTLEFGTRPPGSGDLLLERDAFQVAKSRIGDLVDVTVNAGENRRLHVAGGVHDPGQAQARMENVVYGYITPATLPLLGLPSSLDRLYLLVSGDRLDEAHVKRVADGVAGWLKGQGHQVMRIAVPTPGQHPHAAIMGLLLLTMSAFGGVILAISGIIVLTLALAAMTTQRRQIGVMRAIGGSRGQIAAIYLSQASMLGIAAILVAAPAGMMAGHALTTYLARLLNFDIVSRAIPAWVFLLVVLVGLVVPLAATAYPVITGTATPVRAALDDSVSIHTGRFTWLGPVTGGWAAPLLLGVRNSARRRARTMLTIGTLAASGASFMSALNVRASMMARLDRMFGDGTLGIADRYAFDQHMLMIYGFLLIAAGALGAIATVSLMAATSLNVLERRREFGALRAIGATPATIAGLVVFESAFVALSSWLLAVLLAWPISALLGRLLTAVLFRSGLAVTYSLAGVAGWLAIAVTIGIVASAVPAALASRRSIREANSYE